MVQVSSETFNCRPFLEKLLSSKILCPAYAEKGKCMKTLDPRITKPGPRALELSANLSRVQKMRLCSGKMLFTFLLLHLCCDGTVGKISGAWLSTVALNCINSFYSLPPYTLTRKKNPVSLKNSLGEGIKSTSFIKFQLNPYLLEYSVGWNRLYR